MTQLCIILIFIPIHNYGWHHGVEFWWKNICINFISIKGYTTTRPGQFKLQDDGSAKAVAALEAVYGPLKEIDWISTFSLS